MPSIEFQYDFASPYSYIADCRLDAVLGDVDVQHVPVYLRGFESFRTGIPHTGPKLQYLYKDLVRTSRFYGVEFGGLARFPVNGLYLLRGVIWLEGHPLVEAFRKAAYRATWVLEKDVSTPKGAADVAQSIGLDRDDFLRGIVEPEVKARLRSNTERAIEAGAFGVPNFFVGDEMFFGQDRLDQVAAATSA